MSGVPYTFGNATTSIPLSQLDVNFATNATIGTTSVGLGNTTTTLVGLTNVSTTVVNASNVASNTSLLLQTNGTTTAVTIDTSQNVGVGVTPTAKLDILSTYSSDTASQQRFRDNTGASLNFGGTGGGKKFLQAQDSGGASTYYDILINPYGGSLLVGATTTTNINTNGGFAVLPSAGQAYTSTGHVSGTGSGSYYHACYYNNSIVGGITQVGTSGVVLTSISDYRLKDNVISMQGSLAKVLALNPVTYKWKSDNSDGEGFIAHEIQSVIPTAATGEKDAVDSEGNPKYQGINLSAIVPHLVKAIQELSSQVTALQAKVGV